MSDLAVIQAVRLKWRATPSLVAEIVGLDRAKIDEIVDRSIAMERLIRVEATIKLTDAGRTWLQGELLAERAQIDQHALAARYAQFAVVNTNLKEIIASWQLTDDSTPNDHTDAAYDAQVIDRLCLFHADADALVNAIGVIVPRLARYADRLGHACTTVRAGQPSYVASPTVDSYHQVWFELHEELINLLGRSRRDEEMAASEDPRQ